MRTFWRSGGPAEGIPVDSFSVRWSGKLIPPSTGTYEIGLFSDERGRLYIDDELLMDNWDPFESRFMKSDTLKLEKGREYKIVVEYADFTEFAGMRLTWKQIVEEGENTAMITEAVKLAKRSDVTIVVAGISPRLEGEEMRVRMEGFEGGDRTRLALPESMQTLIKSLHATGKPIILVLTSGSALAVNWANDNIPAILQAWYPGQQGGNAVADVIFGNYNPSGRLPITFYRSVEDLPPFEDYDMEGRTYKYFRGEALYPFGHGLSFTDFTYDEIKLSNSEVSESDSITVLVTLTNKGEYNGDEVVQIYVRDVESSSPQPIKTLKGFKKVYIRAGEKKTIDIPLAIKDLGFYNESAAAFFVEPGEFEIQAGASSQDIRLKTRLFVK
jgi:beta-glucosidase